MALLDKGFKQRIVGALVLVALAVIFLPMLLSRQDELRRVSVEAPAMPAEPPAAEVTLDPVPVPQPVPDASIEESAPEPADPVADTAPEPIEPLPAPPVEEAPAVAQTPAKPVEPEAEAAPAPQKHLDANTLPVSWSVQLASLSSRPGAEKLQGTLRSQGYDAYMRTFDGMNRVFVGPYIDRGDADKAREKINGQLKLNGFIVRFKPEAN
ncbi:SPOR domain-containing protein [Pseudomonas sp. MS19]|uniref:SPOR domain-containing protein n=1 Tax=Pseudomonas sp. MS19 TaxID=2579939 RepID=UPI00156273CA|nr:SPOR domain-containing protein [Pseudomonas sp. MS19]NRH29480.1 SPOR domain-containing protein [Pseudomonas sp. MS19]